MGVLNSTNKDAGLLKKIKSYYPALSWGTLLKLQDIYFSGRVFALLAGFGAVAGSLGVILAGTPFMAGVMRLGWRETIYLLAVVSFILMLSSLFFTQKPVSPSEKKRAISSQGKVSLAGAAEVVKHRASWLLFLCHFGIYGSYAAFIGIWSYPFLVGKAGYTPSQASFFITWVGFSYMLGGPLLGHLSDRLGEKRKPVLLSW